MASSARRRGSISGAGKRRLLAIDSGMSRCKVKSLPACLILQRERLRRPLRVFWVCRRGGRCAGLPEPWLHLWISLPLAQSQSQVVVSSCLLSAIALPPLTRAAKLQIRSAEFGCGAIAWKMDFERRRGSSIRSSQRSTLPKAKNSKARTPEDSTTARPGPISTHASFLTSSNMRVTIMRLV